jgi:hypothetical protein
MAALLDDPIFGMLAYVSLWFLALLFSGFLVPADDLYWPLKTFHYIFPYGYWTRSSCYVTFSEATWIPCTDPTSSAVCVNSTNGIDVLDSFSRVFPLVTSEDTYWQDLGTLVGIGLFWKIISVTTVLFKSRRVAKIQRVKNSRSEFSQEEGEDVPVLKKVRVRTVRTLLDRSDRTDRTLQTA